MNTVRCDHFDGNSFGLCTMMINIFHVTVFLSKSLTFSQKDFNKSKKIVERNYRELVLLMFFSLYLHISTLWFEIKQQSKYTEFNVGAA